MPAFGRSMLEHWLLDPESIYLNHGTVGVTPRRVLQKQQELRDEMERHPSRFMLRELNGHQPMPWRQVSRLREAIAPVAAFLCSRPEDLVFVPNVTTGVNAVLRSLHLEPGDEMLVTDLAYGAIANAATLTAREQGAQLRTIELPYALRHPGQVVDAIVSALTRRTKLVVVDHVTALTALVLPVAEIAAACHERGVPVLVDGAHAPGSRHLDIPALGADWYSANLHKWAHAPRSCGILWAAAERQAHLHYPVVSWGFEKGFREEFERTATSDPTSCLAAPEGIALLHSWHFDDVVDYMHDLAWEGAGILAGTWRTTFDTPRAMVGAMATVGLPEHAGSTDEDAARLRLALLLEDRIEVQIHAWRGRLWVRISAQVYNERSDIERLADAVRRRIS
jgi:isopenicillin-N epimerase